MKIRNGFVTNSSSSSFICDVCGCVESGYDMTLSEAGMYRCEDGHMFCIYHLEDDKKELAIKVLPELIEQFKEYENKNYFRLCNYFDNIKELSEDDIDDIFSLGELNYNIPKEYCPICNLNTITDDDFKNYLIKKYSINEKEEIEKIKEEFKTYEEFEKFLKEK